uniref:Ribosome biogenesis regulatory protein n=2 Tax=Zea mays TaxID=4577 RepID=A0A804RR61_MAIZE
MFSSRPKYKKKSSTYNTTTPFHSLQAEKLREKLRQECLRKGTELAHGVADALFAVPPTEDLDGPIVHLPLPVVRLPREKHLGAGTSLPRLVAAKVGADVTLTDIAQNAEVSSNSSLESLLFDPCQSFSSMVWTSLPGLVAFTKSFGSCGGYIVASKEIIQHLKHSCPAHLYATSMSPPAVQQENIKIAPK